MLQTIKFGMNNSVLAVVLNERPDRLALPYLKEN